MRYLVISDVHANLYALQAVLNDADGQYDRVWFLGDAVGYGPHPNECIEVLAGLRCLGIAGNHDRATLGMVDAQEFNPEAQHVMLWTRSVLSRSSSEFLESLEPSPVVDQNITLVHGSPRHPLWEYVLHPATAAANLGYFSTPYCLFGHTHSPVIYQALDGQRSTCREITPPANLSPQPLPNARLIMNPGSVGQPRDGDARASYTLFDSNSKTMEYRRTRYPVARIQDVMFALDFPVRLISRLALGR